MRVYVWVRRRDGRGYPERYRVLRQDDDPSVEDGESVDGTVHEGALRWLLARLRRDYDDAAFEVGRAWATSWQAIEDDRREAC